MKYSFNATESDSEIVFRLKKKLSSLSEITKERHIDEALYLALFLYSLDEIEQADELLSSIVESFESNDDLWCYVKDAYLIKWSILLRRDEVCAAEKIQEKVVCEEFDLDLDKKNNSEIYERYKYRMTLLPEALEAADFEKDSWFHCSVLGQEVLDSHQYLLYYPYFERCVSESFHSELVLHVDEMYSRLASAVRAS